ncbi:MAG: hypothetical protein MUF08_01180 [Burkholderiaceae bacterium]|jgi:hypothetical protein|nr:hypothetical protein [Burkholderiaceae bacterium]
MRALLPLAMAVLALGAASTWAASDRGSLGTAAELLKGLPPPPGHYDAVMCVTVGGAQASCGPVTADLGGAGQALVRVSDITYRLEIHADQLGVTLFHGTMQIDGFFAPYQWNGSNLHFSDLEKGTRYEVKLGTRRFDTP